MFRPGIRYLCALTALVGLLFFSCTERYPFFIQQPEFIETEAGEGYPGIFLSIVCEDEYAQIRYTIDGSQPTSLHGLVYEEPLYLASQPVFIRAVAVRVGYDAGPEAEYHYEPQN